MPVLFKTVLILLITTLWDDIKMKTYKAFTLAEVLVTLMIIGVIAAMTLPSLNQNIQYNHFVSGCLKSYSVLSQAINRMKVDYGPIGFGTKWNNPDDFWKGLVAQMNVVEDCGKNKNGCWYNYYVKQSNGKNDANYSLGGRGEYRMVTADGMLYSFNKSAFSVHKGYCYTGDDAKLYMGRFVVDINGFKGPNKSGIDVFGFYLFKGKGLLPCGFNMTENTSVAAGDFDFSKNDLNRTGYIIANKKFPPNKK